MTNDVWRGVRRLCRGQVFAIDGHTFAVMGGRLHAGKGRQGEVLGLVAGAGPFRRGWSRTLSPISPDTAGRWISCSPASARRNGYPGQGAPGDRRPRTPAAPSCPIAATGTGTSRASGGNRSSRT
jgi:hypothetical protein